jgi:hypothetical protein
MRVNAPIIPKSSHASDRAFLRQLTTANRQQLRAMLVVFERLVPDGKPFSLAWKRAAVERRLGLERVSFNWFVEGEDG